MMSFAKVRDYCPTANRMADWAFVDNMTTVLKPLATLTTQMQATQYIAGDFFRDYNGHDGVGPNYQEKCVQASRSDGHKAKSEHEEEGEGV